MIDNIDVIGSEKKRLGIYIHIPFCLSKCRYCDFYSTSSHDVSMLDEYVSALCRDIRGYEFPDGSDKLEYLPADTVYFGGGTPTLLNPDAFNSVLSALREKFGICEDAEISCECNPKTADLEKLFAMRRLGINRLSIGAQSACDDELLMLGRAHGFDDCKRIVREAREAGFDNISLDLMYGLPNQTLEVFLNSVDEISALSPEHISSYCLKIEEGTPFYRMRDTLSLPDEDEVCLMYLEMTKKLAEKGYGKYEISNFSLKGRESRHNLRYWECEDYIGFGPSAHSFVGGVRYENARDLCAYISGCDVRENSYRVSEKEAAEEYIMLGMRLSAGVSASQFERRYRRSFEKYASVFEKFAPEFVSTDRERYKFTDRGMLVSNYILSDVLDLG